MPTQPSLLSALTATNAVLGVGGSAPSGAALPLSSGTQLTGAASAATGQCAQPLSQLKSVFTELRSRSNSGVNHVNTYLKASGFPVKPPTASTFALDMIFHVFVLFTALTLLYTFVIAPMESGSLQKEVDSNLQQVVSAGYANATPTQQADVSRALQSVSPLLMRLQASYAKPSALRTEHNAAVFGSAWAIVALLGIVFVVVVAVLAQSKVTVGKSTANVVFENLILFAVVGAVEFMFFHFIASQYIPVMPSQLGENVVSALQSSLAAAAPSSSFSSPSTNSPS
jgi:hypothetical protein